jgi:hypothetical protein
MSIDCTHDDILTAIAGVIVDLKIANIGTPPRVYIVRYPNEFQVTFPAVFVSVEGESERPDERVNVGTDWDYPTRVFYADQDITNTRAKISAELAIRQQLIDAFHMQTPFLAAVPSVYQCKVVPNVIYDATIPTYQHIVSGMVIWSKMRNVRAVYRSYSVPDAPVLSLELETGQFLLTAPAVPGGMSYNLYSGTTIFNMTLLASGLVSIGDFVWYTDLELTGAFRVYAMTAVNFKGESPQSNRVSGVAL